MRVNGRAVLRGVYWLQKENVIGVEEKTRRKGGEKGGNVIEEDDEK